MGDSSITTGDTDILAQVLNVANLNVVGGNYWLVLVNEAGNWIGRILGFDGSNLAGSPDLNFAVDQAGEITVTNAGNGSDSTNTGSVSQENNSTIVQNNDATIINNLNLSANTGGNSASRNTGGNSSITTGDANIVANIVNFVNNNIVGNGRLFVTVVNVFGNWLGDFVGPGYTKEQDPVTDNTSSSGGVGGPPPSGGTQSNTTPASSTADSSPDTAGSTTNSSPGQSSGTLLASSAFSIFGGWTGIDVSDTDVLSTTTQSDGKKTVNLNLAWLLLALPVGGILALTLFILRRKMRHVANLE